MIIGDLETRTTAKLFAELNDAVEALADGRTICLNAHVSPGDIPKGAIVWNQENVPLQVDTTMYQGHEVWDFSERNCEAWRAAGRDVTHVPVGYHPTMERFAMRPWNERDIDVILTGCMNDRRQHILDALDARGLVVAHMPPGTYGKNRDDLLSRSKVAIAPLFYPTGVYGTLRAAHCAANRVPLVSELAADTPSWVAPGVEYDDLVNAIVALVASPSEAQEQAERVYQAFRACPMRLPGPDPWAILRTGEPVDAAAIAKMYDDARGEPVSETLRVHTAIPFYRESWRVGQAVMRSIEAIENDLAQHGISYDRTCIEGDSLICRMRQRVCHSFLMSPATHLLLCDGDIEALDPTCVRKMLMSGHDVVAGAAPFKDKTGRVVCNIWPGTFDKDGEQLALKHGCLDVMDVGTGFVLVSRAALIKLMAAHPELLHWSRAIEDRGSPLWALFDTGIHDQAYQSEDYMFCRRWQDLGGRVYVYVPATFRHWGEYGYEASFSGAFGLQRG